MKRFVKLLTFILALIMVFSLAACNDTGTSPNDDTSSPSGDTTPPTNDTTPPSDDGENGENGNENTENGKNDVENEEEEKEEDTTLYPEKNIICQLKNSTNEQMMGYIFKTSDGKIIAIDGGTKGDTDNLLATLKEISGKDVPHIDAWVLTHPHSDHINAFVEIMTNHFDEVSVDKIYYNFPEASFVEKYESTALPTIEAFNAVKNKFEDKLVVSEVGDKYTIGAAKIEVLFVFDETITFNPINNSSMMFRLTAGGKKMMFLGDAYVQAGTVLLDTYKVRLKSDYCQMAHHGQAGVNQNVYNIIEPSVCFWDAPDWLWDNNNGGGVGSGPWGTLTVRGWMEVIGVKTHIVEKDGNNYFDFDTGVLITK